MAEPPRAQDLLSQSLPDPPAAEALARALAASEEPERALESLLAWLGEAGLDWASAETPVDRFAETAAPALAEAPVAADPSAHPARRARTLDELRAALEAFEGCALKATATQLAFADGVAGAPVMVIGEAPGAEEDRAGKPFVGRAGRLLDKMLAAIGLDRTKNVYIANVVPWRPPGNRTPSPQESAACLPFLMRQIELCAPQIILCVGGPSTQTVLGVKDGIMRARGTWRDFASHGVQARAMATLHPAYLLRQPAHKGLVWRDLRAVRAELARRGLLAARGAKPVGEASPGTLSS
jgi:DNA polymerase